jgi:hypothetical protein
MAIAKGDTLKSISLTDYINQLNATHISVKPKSVHFKKDDEYLGYINRSSKNQGREISMTDPILLDGKYEKDWLGSTPDLNWITAK